jgi:hypothetical protein
MLRLAIAGTIFDFIGILTFFMCEIVNACTYGSGMLIRFSITSVSQELMNPPTELVLF